MHASGAVRVDECGRSDDDGGGVRCERARACVGVCVCCKRGDFGEDLRVGPVGRCQMLTLRRHLERLG